jgi:hypothetical protein
LLKAGVQDPRGAKGDDVSDMEAWRRTAESIGYTHKSVLRADPARPIADAKLRRDIAYDAAMPLLTKQFARRAVIAGSDVRTAAAKGFIAAGIGTASEVSRLTLAFRQRGILQDGQPTKLIWGEIRNHQGQEKIAVTTALHEQEERLLIARAKEAGADRTASLTPEQIEAAIHRLPDLDFATEQGKAQRRIIDHLGQSGKLAVAIGVAGSGKSTLLRPLVQAWQADGRAVHGIALSWRQTDDLQEAGISKENRRAVEPFVRALASGKLQLNARAVVVVDEIGLLGTRQLNELMRARAAQNFTLVAIGDPKQMQAVEAGPVLDLLERALGTDNIPVLASSVRQRDPIERETVLMFRDGQTQEAVERKATNGTLRIVPGGYEEAVGAIVALWEERRSRNRERPDYTISLSAPTNFDAHAVSAEIRKRRRELGEVGDNKITVQASDVGWPAPRLFDLPLAIGDRVRLFRQTNAAGEGKNLGFALGRNGSVLEVADIADAGLRLRAASGIIGYVPWNNLRDPESGRILLDYGEVLTTNTAQGQTVTDHIHAMPGGTKLVSGFGAYTSGSRHREQSFIVVSDGAERAEIFGRRPLGDRREIVVEDVLANIVRNFSRQPEKDSSLALIERAKRLRRGAIRGLQGGAQTLQREGKSDQGSVFARRLAEGRVREALRDRLDDWRIQFKGRASDIAAAAHNLRQMAQRLAAALAQRSKFSNRNWQDVAKAARHSVSKESENIRPRRGPGMKL